MVRLRASNIPTNQSVLNNTGNPQAYEFDIWLYSTGGQADFTLPIVEDKTFNALVYKKTFNVTFEHNNGTSDTTVVRGVEYGESVQMPVQPTYADHNFLGWRYNNNTYQPGTSYESVVSNMTFVGQ
ncbi:MAG: InlB B-repeat-containing protein, partial [Prevotella sp.]|nr:InlB B-repeat-containing protein [Prevotella sp.]